MKQKAKYYNNSIPIDTMGNWLKYKNYHYVIWKGHFTIKELFDIKLQPKRRHRRSMCCVRMMALFGDKDNSRFTRIGKEIGRCKHGKWLYMPKRVRLEVDSPDNKAYRTGRRLSWRKGGAK